MPPKSYRSNQNIFSKAWKFLHEDSPEEPTPTTSQQKGKKPKSQVKNKNPQIKFQSTPIQSNPFLSIIDKYSALQQQKVQARRRKSDKQKSVATTQLSSRQSDLQKQTTQKSSKLKKSASQKTPFSSGTTKAELQRIAFVNTQKTQQSQQETYQDTLKNLFRQTSQTPASYSQRGMFRHLRASAPYQRSPSLQSQWNRQSQIGTRSRVRLQYQKFFDNTDNVFIQETAMMREEAWIDYVWWKVLVIFVINLFVWAMIASIKPYGNPCPRHATCGAYINCHEGYILDRTLKICQIDPRIKQSGLAIMNGVIQDMKYEYGQKECTLPAYLNYREKQEYLKPPKKSLNEIYTDLDIMSEDFRVLRNVLTQYFTDRNNQKLGKFRLGYLDKIEPEEKLYSLSCRVNLLYQHNFIAFIVSWMLFVIFLICLGFRIADKLYKKKGKDIYKFLKQKVQEKKEINYEHYRLQIQEKFNRNRQISEQLWLLINDFRIQQKLIGSYECTQGNGHYIYWKTLAA